MPSTGGWEVQSWELVVVSCIPSSPFGTLGGRMCLKISAHEAQLNGFRWRKVLAKFLKLVNTSLVTLGWVLLHVLKDRVVSCV